MSRFSSHVAFSRSARQQGAGMDLARVRRRRFGRSVKMLALAVAAVASFDAMSARGATNLYWDPAGVSGGAGATPTGTWDTTTGNWSLSSTGGSGTTWVAADDAYFTAGVSGTDALNPYTVTVSPAALSTAGIINNMSTGALTISASASGKVLTINGDGITNNLGAGAMTIGNGNLGIALGAAQTWTNNSASTLTVGGIVSGSGALIIAGTGTTSFSAANSFTGGVTVNTGATLILSGLNATSGGFTMNTGSTVDFNSTQAFGNAGSNNVTINGGTLDNTSGAALISGKAYVTAINGDFTFAGGGTLTAHDLNLGTGAVTLGGAGTARTITTTASNSTLTFGGIIGNGTTAKAIIKAGAGTLSLGGANTFSGGLTITNGTVGGTTNAAAFGTGTITLGDGTLANSNSVTLLGDGRTFANAIALTDRGTYTGTAAIGATNGAAAIYTGGITGNNDLVINSPTGATSITLQTGAINNTGTITNSSVAGTSTISANVGSNVTAISENSATSTFTVSGNLTVNGSGTTLANNQSTKTFTVSGNVSGSGALTLQNNGSLANSLTLSGTTINNSGTITNSGSGSGAVLISGGLGALVSNVTQSSANGTLTLSGTNTAFAGTITLSAGTLNLGSATALGGNGSTSGTGGALTISAGTLNASAATALTTVNTENWNGSFTFGGTNTLSTGTGAISLGANVMLTNSGASLLTIGGGLTSTGTDNLTFMATAGGGVTFTGLVNNTGTITNSSTNGGIPTFSGGIGSNVTAITENTTTSDLVVSGALAVNSSGTTLTNSLGTTKLKVQGGVTGTGPLILKNNSALAAGITISALAVNNSNTITNSGAGTGDATISGGVGSNVTAITENSTTSALNIITTGMTIGGSATTTLTNSNASGSALFTVSGGITTASGSGSSLVLSNNSAIANGITLSGTSINPTGTITNSGSGNGNTLISAVIGTAVTGVTESSTSSTFVLSGTNTYTSATTITKGTLSSSSNTTPFGSGAGTIYIGDTTASNSNAATLLYTGMSTTISDPLTINAGSSGLLSISTNTTSPTFTGAITLNNNLTLDNTTSGQTTSFSGLLTESSSALTLTKGTGAGSVTLSGGIGVSSAGLTLLNSGAGTLTESGAITGSGSLLVKANSTGGITLSTGGLNIVGSITNSGTGAGTATISGTIGTNVTGISQTNASPLLISGGLTLGANLVIASSGSGLLTLSGGVTGAHNLTLQANSTGGITLSGTSVNNGGTITNSGGSSGTTTISAVIGTNVTGVVENSANSAMILTGVNTYASGSTDTSGTVVLGASSTATTAWVASTARALGVIAVPTAPNGYYYNVTTAGTSGSSQPAWSTTLGATFTDGTITYTVCANPTGPVGTGTLTLNGGTLQLQSANQTLSSSITLADNSMVSGADFASPGTNRTLTLSGPISGTGGKGLTVTGGIVDLSNTGSTFSGNVQVKYGTLQTDGINVANTGAGALGVSNTVTLGDASNNTVARWFVNQATTAATITKDLTVVGGQSANAYLLWNGNQNTSSTMNTNITLGKDLHIESRSWTTTWTTIAGQITETSAATSAGGAKIIRDVGTDLLALNASLPSTENLVFRNPTADQSPTFTGGSTFNEGMSVFSYNAASITSGTFGTGAITLNNGAQFTFQPYGTNTAYSYVSETNNFNIGATGGTIWGWMNQANANAINAAYNAQVPNFSGTINLAGRLDIGAGGSGIFDPGGNGTNIKFSGGIVVDQATTASRMIEFSSRGYDQSRSNFSIEISGNISDGTGSANNPVHFGVPAPVSTDPRTLTIDGANNTFAGGAIIDAANNAGNWVIFTTAHGIGSGAGSVASGGYARWSNVSVGDNAPSFNINSGGTLDITAANSHLAMVTDNGALQLSADQSTASGATVPTIGSGGIVVLNSNITGSFALGMPNASIIKSVTSTHSFAGNLAVTGVVQAGDGTANGAVTLSGNITGSGVLISRGANTISGTSNTYTGGTLVDANNVNTGLTVAGASSSLGSGAVRILSGGRLQLAGTANVGSGAVTLNSGGVSLGVLSLTNTGIDASTLLTNGSTGVIAIDTGGTYSTAINQSTLGSNSSAGTTFLGSTLTTSTYSGTLTAGANNTYRLGGGGGTLTVSSTLADLTSPATSQALIVGSTATNGAGTAKLSVANTFTGGITVNSGSTLEGPALSTTLAGTNSPFGSTSNALTLSNATLQLDATATSTLYDTLGAVTANGNSTLKINTANSGSNITTLTVASLGRGSNNGVIQLSTASTLGAASGAAQRIISTSTTNLGTTAISGGGTILTTPFVLGSNISSPSQSGFVTYIDGTNGFREVVPTLLDTGAANQLSTIPASGGILNHVVYISGADATMTANTTVQALTLNGNFAVTNASGTPTLTIAGGGLIISTNGSGGITLGGNGMTLNFGTAEAIIRTPGTAMAATISAPITNTSGGLTKTGAGQLLLTNTANSFTGTVTVDQGNLSLGFAANGTTDTLGNPNNTVVLNGGALSVGNATAIGTETFSRAIALGNVGGTLSLATQSNGNASTVSVTSVISGASGTGPLSLTFSKDAVTLNAGSNANSYTGGTIITASSAGSLTVANGVALGTGDVYVAYNGTATNVTLQGDSNINSSARLSVDANSSVTFQSGTGTGVNAGAPTIGALEGSGSVVLGKTGGIATNLTVGGNNTSTVFDGVISQAAGAAASSLTKTGTGTFTLANVQTYAGTTTISNGKLVLLGSLAGGAQVDTTGTLGGTGSISGAVTTASTGTISPGQDSTPGKLTINNTLNMSGTYKWKLSPAGNDLLQVNGDLNVTGTPTVHLANPTGAFLDPTGQPAYTMINYTGGLPGGQTTWAIDSNRSDTAMPNVRAWTGSALTGLWADANSGTSNWGQGVWAGGNVSYDATNKKVLISGLTVGGSGNASVPTIPNDVVISPAGVVTVQGPTAATTVNSLTIGDGSGNSQALVLQTGGSLNVSGAVTIRSNGSLDGTLATLTAATVTNSGSLTLGNGSTIGTIASTSALQSSYTGTTTVATGSTVTANTIRQNTLHVVGTGSVTLNESSGKLADGWPSGTDGAVSVLGNLSFDSTAKLDVTNNDLIITGMTVANVESMVRNGYSNGDWDGSSASPVAGDAAFGKIVSTDAALRNIFTLLVMDSGSSVSSFDTVTGIPAHSVIVKFTHEADLNGDGVVTGTGANNDLSLFASYYAAYNVDNGTSTQRAVTHAQGDMDFDGKLTFNDAQLFTLYYNEFTALNGAHLPEPTSLAFLALGAAGLLARKRR